MRHRQHHENLAPRLHPQSTPGPNRTALIVPEHRKLNVAGADGPQRPNYYLHTQHQPSVPAPINSSTGSLAHSHSSEFGLARSEYGLLTSSQLRFHAPLESQASLDQSHQPAPTSQFNQGYLGSRGFVQEPSGANLRPTQRLRFDQQQLAEVTRESIQDRLSRDFSRFSLTVTSAPIWHAQENTAMRPDTDLSAWADHPNIAYSGSNVVPPIAHETGVLGHAASLYSQQQQAGNAQPPAPRTKYSASPYPRPRREAEYAQPPAPGTSYGAPRYPQPRKPEEYARERTQTSGYIQRSSTRGNRQLALTTDPDVLLNRCATPGCTLTEPFLVKCMECPARFHNQSEFQSHQPTCSRAYLQYRL